MDIAFVTRKFQKSIAGLSLFAILSSLVSFAGVAQAGTLFSDLADDHYAAEAVEALVADGVMSGYGNGNFGTNDSMTRAQLAKVVVGAFGIDTSTAADFAVDFTDMPGGDLDLFVKAAAQNGIMTGYADGSKRFGSSDPVQRQDLAVVLHRITGLTEMTDGGPHFPDADEGDYFYGAVETLYWYQVVNGYANGRFGTGDKVTRADASLMVFRATGDLELREEDSGPVVEGDLEVYLASSTPEAQNVPKNGFEVPYATVVFDATASDADVEVTNVTVTRSGLGESTNFDKVKLYQGYEQLGGDKTLSSSDDTANFNLTSEPIVVPAGSKVLVDIVGDMAGGSINGAVNSLGIESASDVVADASVGGDFPVVGEEMTLANVTVGALTLEHTDVTGDLEVGDTDEILGRFSLEASSTEDIEVEMLKYKHTGSAEAEDYAGLELRDGGVVVGTPEWDGDYLIFDFSDEPLLIEDGEDRNFVLYGDVVGGVNTTSSFEVKDTQDVIAYGTKLGFRSSVTESSAFTPTSRNIDGGVINLSLAADNPSANEVGINQDDIEFMRFNITTAGDGILITQFGLDLDPSANANAAQLERVRIVRVDEDGTYGETVAGATDPASTVDNTTESLVFTEDFEVAAQGTETFAILADTDSTVVAADTFAFVIDASDLTAEYLAGDQDDVAGADLPTADVTGSTMTIAAPTLTVTGTTQPGDQTMVKNATGIEVAAFNFRANGVSDLEVTSVKLHLNSSGTGDEDDVDNVTLYLEEDGVWTPVSSGSKSISSSTSSATFSTGFTVEKDSSVRLLVVADIPSTAVAGHIFSLGFESESGDITVNDEKGSTSNVAVSLVEADGTANTANGRDSASDVEITVAAAGTLSVALDGETPSASVISTGKTMVPVSTFQFTSQNEAFEVAQFQVKVDDAADADEVLSVTVKYEDEAGELVTSTETLAGQTANFAGETLWVPKNGEADLWVFVNTASEAAGADSGTTLGVDLDFDTNFEAFGDASSTRSTSVGSGDVAGSHHSVYASDLLVKVNSGSASGSSVGGQNKDVFTVDLIANGQNTPSVMAMAFTVGGNATLSETSTTGSAILKDANGDTEATEARVTATSDGASADASTISFAALASVNGIPMGATVRINDGGTYYTRTIASLPSSGDVTFTPAITSYNDDAADTLTYIPLQPGSGKLYFGAATGLGVNLVDNTTTAWTVTSTNGFSVGDTITARGATITTGVVLECTGTISAIANSTTLTSSAAQCTGDGTLDFDYDALATAVVYTGLIDEEVTGTEKFTVNGDTTGAEPSSTGSRTIQVSINSGSDITWNDDWSDLADDLDAPEENTSFFIQSTLLNVEKDGYTTFPVTGGALLYST